MYYILLDEVQMMEDFVDAMNSFLHMKHVDVYVTGRNSKFLSKDIVTEFRGRGDEIRVYPLSFSEFYSSDIYDHFTDAFKDSYTFGGLPYILECHDDLEKADYLKQLFKETYIKDIMERNAIKHRIQLEELIHVISTLTKPNKLSNTFKSKQHVSISLPTIKQKQIALTLKKRSTLALQQNIILQMLALLKQMKN